MKTYFIALIVMIGALLFLSGCSTVSEYNQGCRDGLSFVPVHPSMDSTWWNKEKINICDSLDDARIHKADRERIRPGIAR